MLTRCRDALKTRGCRPLSASQARQRSTSLAPLLPFTFHLSPFTLLSLRPTCEAVISESHFLLQGIPGGAEALYALLERGIISVSFSLTRQLAETVRLIRRYSDVPISLTDACLVRMAELEESTVVFTTDADFRLYRRNGRHVIPLIIPT